MEEEKIIEEEKKWWYKKAAPYQYWPYKEGMVKKNGKVLKKNGRKKWQLWRSKVEIANLLWVIINNMTFWVDEITHKTNIKHWVKSGVPLNLAQACLESWLHYITFHTYMERFPTLQKKFDKLKEKRREYMKNVSESNIEKAITGKMKWLWDKEVVDYSFRMLEKTSKEYNPKQVIEQTVEEINPDRSTADILADITDLLQITNGN